MRRNHYEENLERDGRVRWNDEWLRPGGKCLVCRCWKKPCGRCLRGSAASRPGGKTAGEAV